MKFSAKHLESYIDYSKIIDSFKSLKSVLDELGIEVKRIEKLDDDVVFTVETLADRADHLGVLGIAREVGARYFQKVVPPTVSDTLSSRPLSLGVFVDSPDCYRYEMIEMTIPEGFVADNKLFKPLGHLAERSPLVHSANLVQLEIGQPLHVFDREKIRGDIKVINCKKPETGLLAIDGNKYDIPAGTLVIADSQKILAIAGIIGLQNSCVTGETSTILVESACFNPVLVRKTCKAIGLYTDASRIFEKGSDVDMTTFSLRRFKYLTNVVLPKGDRVALCTGYHQFLEFKDRYEERFTRHIPISLAKVRACVSSPRLKEDEVIAKLGNLGFSQVENPGKDQITVKVPSWRIFDTFADYDVVGDFLRVYGYNRVKIEDPPLSLNDIIISNDEIIKGRIEEIMIGQGFTEVITKAYYSEEHANLLISLDGDDKHIRLKNAIESANSSLRVSPVLHLAELCEKNLYNGVPDAKVFEYATIFKTASLDNQDHDTTQRHLEQYIVSFATYGVSDRSTLVADKKRSEQFLVEALVGSMISVLDNLGINVDLAPSDEKILHPNKQIGLKKGRDLIGFAGVVHPEVRSFCGGRANIIYGQFDLALIGKHLTRVGIKQPSKFPTVTRDVTFIAVKPVKAGNLLDIINKGFKDSELVCSIVDDFHTEGERRLTVRFTFAPLASTLTKEDVDRRMEQLEQLQLKDFSIQSLA